MQQSYTLNYLKIYFWQGMSIVLNLLAMFIVIPLLSRTPAIFGIYSIAISLTVFLSYADLGFIGAGYKYTSESFARKDRKEEINTIGFVSFILFIFAVLYAVTVTVFAVYPNLLIRELNDPNKIKIASNLLFILAIFSPFVVFRRSLEIIYGIRLENYIFQKILIISSLVKILSVLYFFSNDKYDIVGYFLFFQIMNFIAILASLAVAKKRYNYNFILLFKSFKFSKRIYNKTKGLAFTTLYLTFAWILFHELDAVVIGKLLGPEMVAIYAIGLTLTTFIRSIFGTLYSPFFARFNHFIGLNDMNGLRKLFHHVIIITMPVIVFTILSLFILMKPFILSWVGPVYLDSVLIAKFLILGYIIHFIIQPSSILLMALKKIKIMIIANSILFFVYWVGIAITISYLGLKSFAFFKFTAFILVGLFYLIIALKFLKLKLIYFINKIIFPVIIPSALLIGAMLFLHDFMPIQKNRLNVIIVVAAGIGISIFSLFLYSIFSKKFANYINKILKNIFINRLTVKRS